MKWLILLVIIGYNGNEATMTTGKRFDNLGECLQEATSEDFRQAVIDMYKDKGIQKVLFYCKPEEQQTGA